MRILWMAAAAALAWQGGQSANQPRMTVVDLAPPPSTLAAMVGQSTLVVHATVESSDPPIRFPGRSTIVRYHTMTVREVLKSAESLSSLKSFKLLELGGKLVIDGQEWSTYVSEVALRPGDEAVLFLSQRAGQDYYAGTFGGAIFLLDKTDRSVAVPSFVQASVVEFATLRRMPLTELLSAIRQRRLTAGIHASSTDRRRSSPD